MTTLSGKPGFRDVVPRVDVDELERGVLAFWEKEHIFEESRDQHKDRGDQFTFYDGPPYATGKPHYGHILQSAIKDTVLRYKTMRGFYVPRRVGWDCHGLPVETLVEKELGFASKKDIEAYGIEQFNQKCRETVTRYVQEFTDTLKRMGRWADYDNAYFTLNREYMETEWWVFKQLWQQELVYKAFRSTPYCIRCATPLSNFEVSSNYKDTTDTAVYVLLKVRDADDLYLLVWTTTPWTLPGNVAVAYSPDPGMQYVIARSHGKRIVLLKDAAQRLFGNDVEIEEELTSAGVGQLVGYEPLYPDVVPALGVEPHDNLFTLVRSDHVTADEGTGLVHIAPAFGEEDTAVGKRADLPVLRTVAPDGRFVAELPQWGGANIFSAQKDIVADLEARGVLFKQEQYTHSYPFCWRCETPLIYYALDTWFVNIAQLKEQMLASNDEQITWIPEHVKRGRFRKGIESAPDWAVSRNRYWSVPLPIWECDKCREQVVVGSVAELQEFSGVADIPDLHRPYVDELTWECTRCVGQPSSAKASAGTVRRVSEVLDVWFDAGSMPYAQSHYPFDSKTKELTEKSFPADFIVEAIEQTRLWFYVLHVLATALTRQNEASESPLQGDGVRPAFRNAIGAGLIFAEDGQKLSKKLKNYPEPEPTIKKYGADSLRLYLLSSAALGEPYRFSEKDLQQLYRNVYMRLWNVYSFFVRYANTHGWTSEKEQRVSQHILDRWILAQLSHYEQNIITLGDTYHIDAAARHIVSYIDGLSNWYVRRSRARFQALADDADRRDALATLHAVLVRTARLLAPFMPFVAEEIYRNLTGEQSVHLELLPDSPELTSDERSLRDAMNTVRRIVAEGLGLRARAGIKVRQPLARLGIQGEEGLSSELVAIVCDEINIKELSFVDELPQGDQYVVSDEKSRVSAALDTLVTPELAAEGVVRDLIRHGQSLRKQAGYALDDRITLVVRTDSSKLQQAISQHEDALRAALQADTLADSVDREDAGDDVTVAGATVHLGVVRAG